MFHVKRITLNFQPIVEKFHVKRITLNFQPIVEKIINTLWNLYQSSSL